MKPEMNINPVLASLDPNSDQTEAMKLLMAAGSDDPAVASKAQNEIASGLRDVLNGNYTEAAVGTPLKEAILDGDIVSNIFQNEPHSEWSDLKLELDFLAPGAEKNHYAFTMPDHGKIPHRLVKGDYIQMNTFRIANTIGCTRKYFRNSRMDVLGRMMEVLQMGFTKKNNDDGWKTLLGAGKGRGILSYDTTASAGQFTPKLVSVMKSVMRRNGGGNSSSVNRFKLTDLYVSPEAMEDMVTWGLNLIPDAMREQIFRNVDGSIGSLFGVNFHDIDELGVGQEYQAYYQNTLSGSLAASDEELVVGFDLSRKNKAFIRPVTQTIQVFEDNTLHRDGLVGFYGDMYNGWTVADVRFIMLGSF